MRKYFDSSAIVNVIVDPRNQFTWREVGTEKYFTSRLSQVEVFRTITKVDPSLLTRAAAVLSRIQYLEITDRVIDDASRYPQEITLKSSDAIHMATAELLLDVNDALVTLDKQMALNAQKLGIKVASL